ncbi:DASH complex subunit Dam1 [Phlyctema vagabunda]|uniref:DASH complex subunit DAM1 n=1 Tax=Phlyctema vagabunda TaxID=108571 RepID=A0ABR4P3Y5_9HELO
MAAAASSSSSTTTPLALSSAPRSTSQTRHNNNNNNSNAPSRPTTPLRPSSRSSLRSSTGVNPSALPLDTFEPYFAELSDGMADLEANFMHLQLMHESLARFSENFGAFLYGLNMNAFCVDFSEAPIPDSFRRAQEREERSGRSTSSERFHGEIDGETTFMTTDTSFVDNPPTSSKATPKKFTTPVPASRIASASTSTSGIGRGGGTAGRGGAARGGMRGTRGSGLARARGRGVR